MKLDVSVIVAAYNVGRYLEQAVRSALEQQDVTVEVIVVDDASTDNTWQVLETLKNERLITMRLPQNGGPGVARNAAIAKASGTWIAVLDGDDALEPNRLKHCLIRAESTGADIVVDNLTVRRETDGACFPMFPKLPVKMDLAAFIRGNTHFLGGYSLGYLKPLFSAAFLKAHRLAYEPGITIGEDYLLLAEALASGAQCMVAPSAGYLYNARAGSTSHRLTLADIDRMASADALFLSRHRLSSDAAAAQKKRTARLNMTRTFILMIDALKQRNAATAFKAAAKHPAALWYLWMPAWARLKKFYQPTEARS